MADNNSLLISPGESLIEEIFLRLNNQGQDYSSNMIIFPGKRPGHFLRKAIGEKEGKSFIPPLIFSMDEFVDFIYEEKLQLGGRKLETIDSATILYEIHCRADERLGGKGFLTADIFLPLGLKIYNDIEEFYLEGISPQKIKEIKVYTEEKIPLQSLKGLQSLAFFYEKFYQKVEENGFSTRAYRYRKVSENLAQVDLSLLKQIIFAGFFALTKAEQDLFKELLLRDNTLFIFQDAQGIGERLKDLGIEYIPQPISLPSLDNKVNFYKSPDTHGEIFTLNTLLKETPGEDTVIVIPSSATLFPLLNHSLSQFDSGTYNLSMGYPLYRTPVFGFFNNLMEVITSMDEQRIYVPAYLKFILHPYTKNIYFKNRADINRIIFHAIEEEFIKLRTKTFFSLEELEGDEEIFIRIARKMFASGIEIKNEEIKNHLKSVHQNTIGKFLSFQNIGDFSFKSMEVLIYIYENSTARLHPFFHPFSEHFIKILYQLSCSLLKDIKFEKAGGYFNLIKKFIINCHTPFEGTPINGLQVLGFLETRNLKFKRVFIFDVNEEILPNTIKEDSLLPFKARKILGLPTYLDREKLIAYYFDILFKGAEEVNLFFVENDQTEKSRFIEKLLWERQKIDKKIDYHDHIKSIQYSVKLKNTEPKPIEKTGPIISFLTNYAYSAGALDNYLKCGLKFYYETAVKLKEKEYISQELEKKNIGIFIHQVLGEYFDLRKGIVLTAKDLDLREMNLLIDKNFSLQFGKDLSGAVYLLKKQIKYQLREFIVKYQIPNVKDCPVTVLEIERPVAINKNGFNLKGRMDRIEKRGEKIFILDYKTSASDKYLKISWNKIDPGDRESWGKWIKTLQLPFYSLLYAEKYGEKIENIQSLFLLLGKTSINKKIEVPLYEESDDVHGKSQVMEEIIFKLLAEIINSEKPFMPPANKKDVCPHCDLQYLCGTQWLKKTGYG